VKKLMLISSIGLMEKPENFDIGRMEVIPMIDADGNEIKNKGPGQIHLRYMWTSIFERKISPFSFGMKFGKTITKVVVDKYVAMKLNTDNRPEK
jgi:hypothetical protein